MAVDKLVDSAQLDADLTSVANAIRTKGGTSASLAFPAGFVSAIGDIPTGGSGVVDVRIEIGSNSVSKGNNLITYLKNALGVNAILYAQLEESPAGNNQFVSYNIVTNITQGYRWRNSASNAFTWSGSTYDVVLTVGTHYRVIGVNVNV